MKKIFLFLLCSCPFIAFCQSGKPMNNGKNPSGTRPKALADPTILTGCIDFDQRNITQAQLDGYKTAYLTWVNTNSGANAWTQITLDVDDFEALSKEKYITVKFEPVIIPGNFITIMVEGWDAQGVIHYNSINCFFGNKASTPIDRTTKASIFCPPPFCNLPTIADSKKNKAAKKDAGRNLKTNL